MERNINTTGTLRENTNKVIIKQNPLVDRDPETLIDDVNNSSEVIDEDGV
jgi:hypothetical protein